MEVRIEDGNINLPAILLSLISVLVLVALKACIHGVIFCVTWTPTSLGNNNIVSTSSLALIFYFFFDFD